MAYAWILQNLALLGLDTRHLVSLPDIPPPPSPLSLPPLSCYRYNRRAHSTSGGFCWRKPCRDHFHEDPGAWYSDVWCRRYNIILTLLLCRFTYSRSCCECLSRIQLYSCCLSISFSQSLWPSPSRWSALELHACQYSNHVNTCHITLQLLVHTSLSENPLPNLPLLHVWYGTVWFHLLLIFITS